MVAGRGLAAGYAAIIAGPPSPLADGISDQVFLRDTIMAVTRSDSEYAQHAAMPLKLASSQPLITYAKTAACGT
jgi:hypothetical protein